jgi:hypothetical protein
VKIGNLRNFESDSLSTFQERAVLHIDDEVRINEVEDVSEDIGVDSLKQRMSNLSRE